MHNSSQIFPDISIVFVSWNRRSDVAETLRHLSAFASERTEIILVDNGSADETAEMVRNEFPGVQLLQQVQNTGIAAYNAGIKLARGRYCLLLDDDSHVDGTAIEQVVKTFDSCPEYGVLAFKIVLPSTGEVVTRDWSKYLTSFWGCGFAVRRDLVSQIGFYDEKLFLYTNEYDFAIRVWNYGMKVVYCPDIVAYHRVSAMNRVSGRLVRLSVRNDVWFNRKYIPFPYLIYTLPTNLISWLVRSILERTWGEFCSGLVDGFRGWSSVPSQPVHGRVIWFYLLHHRNFENPFIKALRKLMNGTLFAKVKNV